MEGKRLTTRRKYVNKDGGEEPMVNQLRGEVMLGDVVWVRLRGCSWWPAQVVEENTVSERIKPNNRSVGEVLVRLYGSYDYLYADIMKCRSDFENILKQNNGSYIETFQKALEQDLSHIKSGRLKRRGSEPREKARVEASKDKKLKQDGIKKKQEVDGLGSTQGDLGKSPGVSVRGTRAMKVDFIDKKSKDSKDEALKNEKPKQHKKNNKADDGASASVSPRKLQGVSTQRARVTRGGLFAVKAREETKSETSKQDMKNNKADNGASASVCPRKLKGVSTQRTRVKHGDLLAEKARDEAKSETPKQDRVLKKLKSAKPSLTTVSSEKSQDLSARRMKVMRNLGLVAPCGSPFHRNGLTLPSI